MYLVGGKRQPQNLKEWIACRPLHGLDHDFVVPIEPALPRLRLGRKYRTVSCDHYSYFEPAERATLSSVVEFLTAQPLPDTEVDLHRVPIPSSPGGPGDLPLEDDGFLAGLATQK